MLLPMLLQVEAFLMLLVIAMVLLLTTLVIPWIFSLTSSRAKTMKEEIIEVVKCLRCGYETVRKYEKGDYVGKVVGSCPSDGGQLIVKAIYLDKYPQVK